MSLVVLKCPTCGSWMAQPSPCIDPFHIPKATPSEEIDRLRRDLAASRAECERLRGVCEMVIRHMKRDYWRQAGGYQRDADRVIAALREALATPDADAGDDPVAGNSPGV